MLPRSLNREFAFSLNDVARMLRTYADYKAAHFGITRAQWAVLARLDRFEGLKQSELAEMLDLQPITLTRLLDRLSECGLIERRSDPNDRRAKRLFLTPAARPMLEQFGDLGDDIDGHGARRRRPRERRTHRRAACDREGKLAPGDPAKERRPRANGERRHG